MHTNMHTNTQGPALLTHHHAAEGPTVGAAVQEAVDAFNRGSRKKTLVEQHQERLQKKQVWGVLYGEWGGGCTTGGTTA